MRFEELNEYIPYVKGGKEKLLQAEIYPNVKIAMPGRHAEETDPKYGDFVVMVTDPVFALPDHQFTHTDIFNDIQYKTSMQANPAMAVMKDYLLIVKGSDLPTLPLAYEMTLVNMFDYGISVPVLLAAMQCLAVAEHRRYAKFESKWGGRYLPFRFAAGIAQGLWTAEDAISMQRKGRPGVEILEKLYGVPALTQELMK